MRVKYISEAPNEQGDRILLDEYMSCAIDHFEDRLTEEQRKSIEEYIVALRDEILRRIRGNAEETVNRVEVTDV